LPRCRHAAAIRLRDASDYAADFRRFILTFSCLPRYAAARADYLPDFLLFADISMLMPLIYAVLLPPLPIF